MRKILPHIYLGIVAAFALLALLVSLRLLELRKKEVENNIRFQCAQIYRFTQTSKDGATVSYPMEKEYQECLRDRDL